MEFKVFDLGLVEFKQAWEFQKEIFQKVKNGLLESGLILCQHYSVITLGRSADKKNILISEQGLRDKGISVYPIERGGDVTYHGPGQLMVYPVFNLNYFKKDIHLFLRNLEQAVIDFLGQWGIEANRRLGLTGVWIKTEKIASVGITIRNWITFHGLSINVKRDDLDNFCLIRPCGMNITMTSIETILNSQIKMESVKEKISPIFKEVFNDQGSFAGIR